MTAQRRGRRGQGGFALVEVLVALGVLGLGLGLLFGVVGDNALRSRIQGDRQAALLVARSQLEAAGTAYALDGREVSGVSGPLAYAVRSRPYETAAPSTAGQLWLVTVSVWPRAGGSVIAELRSLRLGPAR